MIRKALAPLVLLLGALTPCLAQRNLKPDDPNMNSKWDWSTRNQVNIYHDVYGLKTPKLIEVFLPFCNGSSKLSNSFGNVFQEDGWQLVHRDFGTEAQGVSIPYYTLYNRYRGLFRVCIFNTVQREDTFYVGELKFKNATTTYQYASPLFTFNCNTEKQFALNYDKEMSISSITTMDKYNSWGIFDFNLVGYDPNLVYRDPVLEFKLVGVKTSKLKLSGKGNLELKQVFPHGMPSYPSRREAAVSSLVSSMDGAWSFNSVTDWTQQVAQNPMFKDESWFPILEAAAKVGGGSYAPIFTAAYSVLSSWIGGTEKCASWEPFSLKGQFNLDLEGGMERSSALLTLLLGVNTKDRGIHASNIHRPVQQVPWGLFNLNEQPTFTYDHGLRLAKEPDLLINPEAGLELVSKTYKLNTYLPEYYWDAASKKNQVKYFRPGQLPLSSTTSCAPGKALVKDMMVELKFRATQKTTEAPQEYTVLKRVPLKWVNETDNVTTLDTYFGGEKYMAIRSK